MGIALGVRVGSGFGFGLGFRIVRAECDLGVDVAGAVQIYSHVEVEPAEQPRPTRGQAPG